MFEPVCNPLHQSLLSCQEGKKGLRIMFSNNMSTAYAPGIHLKISDEKHPFFRQKNLCFLFNWEKKKKSVTDGITNKYQLYEIESRISRSAARKQAT